MKEVDRTFIEHLHLLFQSHGKRALSAKYGVAYSTVMSWRSKMITQRRNTLEITESKLLKIVRKHRESGTPLQQEWFPPDTLAFLAQARNDLGESKAESNLAGSTLFDNLSSAYTPEVGSLEYEMDLKDIAEWEKDFDSLRQFWVILPLSLVVFEPGFKDVMLQNIRRGVTYVYFIKDAPDEHARIASLGRELQEHAIDTGVTQISEVEKRVRVIALQPIQAWNFLNKAHRLIANPNRTVTEGVEVRYGKGERPSGGNKLDQTQLNETITILEREGVWDPTETLPGKSFIEYSGSSEHSFAVKEAVRSLENQKSISIRTPGHSREKFSFSMVGNCHMHLDVTGNPDALEQIWQHFLLKESQWKVSTIADSIRGPQATKDSEYQATYNNHDSYSTDANGTHRLDFFVTTDLTDNVLLAPGTKRQREEFHERASVRIGGVLNEIRAYPGVVLEVERVIGRIENDGDPDWCEDVDSLRTFTAEDVGFQPATTMPIEIHHGFDLVKDHDPIAPPVSLAELSAAARSSGLDLGGWFTFFSGTHWLYRSNCFVKHSEDYRAIAESQHGILRALLASDERLGNCVQQRTVVEQILGIWTSRPTT